MATAKLTKRTIDATHKGAKDLFVWDEELSGFGLKVTPAGAKIFIYQYRLGGRGTKTKRWTIGRFGSPWTPEQARKEGERLARLVDSGIDPVEEQKQRRRLEATLGFTSYVDTFTDGYLKTDWGDSWPQAKRQLEMHVIPRLKDTPLPDITSADCNAVLDALIGKPGLRRNVWAVMSKLFSWAEDREDIERAPKIVAPPVVKARKRILSTDELIACWRASFTLDHPRGHYVRLLMITLQRRGEIAALPWSELKHNECIWHLPGERAKNGEDHLVPLSDLAREELDALGWKKRGLVLPSSTGTTPISNFSDIKKALDEAMLPILQELADERADAAEEPRHEVELQPWRIHDLRRTGTTNLQALGFQIEVTERVINHHQGGTTAGIRGVYNLHEYAEEKRRALQAWADHLRQLVSGVEPASNVVPLAQVS